MSSESRSRRFLGQPKGSKLWVAITVADPGSVGVTTTFSEEGTSQPAQPAVSVMTFPCNRANTVYQLDIDMAWVAKGKVVIACWLEQPSGEKLHRKSMDFDGASGDVDSALMMVVTS